MVKLKYKKETSSGGIVYRKTADGVEWLITQHSLHKGWGFPKGLIGDIDTSEDKETAALREVEEEGGVKTKIVVPEPVEVKYKYQHEGTLVDKNVFYFLMEYLSGDPKDHDWEVSEAKFIPEKEVWEILTFPTDKEAFKKILSVYNSLHDR
jgi:8-oxo-dGTP pyrophosphatase MutT (NUDIX family)